MSVATPPAERASAPVSDACPMCGAPLRGEQDWCLSCGAAARTRLAATPNWRAPIAVLAILAALALGVLAPGPRRGPRPPPGRRATTERPRERSLADDVTHNDDSSDHEPSDGEPLRHDGRAGSGRGGSRENSASARRDHARSEHHRRGRRRRRRHGHHRRDRANSQIARRTLDSL